MRYIRKPKEVEAMKYDGTNADAIEEWSERAVVELDFNSMIMMTKYGEGVAAVGMWVIKGPCGLFYPCSDKEFKDNYWELAK